MSKTIIPQGKVPGLGVVLKFAFLCALFYLEKKDLEVDTQRNFDLVGKRATKLQNQQLNKALIALAIGGFGIGMTEFVIMGILPEIADSIGVSIPVAGHFISAYALGVVAGAPVLTIIGGKWPPKRMLIGLMLWFTVFNTLSAFANSYSSLLVMRFLSGLPHGAFFGIGAVVAAQLATPGKSARAMAVMFSGLTFANVLGVPLGTYVGQNYDWSITFQMVGVVGVLTVASIYFWMPTQLKTTSSGNIKGDLKMLTRPELWMVVLMTAVGTGGFFAWYSYIAPLVTEVAHYPDYMVGYTMILAGLGMVVGNFVGARLADLIPPIHAVIIFMAVMAIALAANTFFADFKIGILVMTFLIGTLSFCLSAPVQMTMINTAKGAEMIGSSLNQSAFNIGNALGAYLGGLPIAMGYGFASADWVGAAMAACGVVIAGLIVLIRRRKSQLDLM